MHDPVSDLPASPDDQNALDQFERSVRRGDARALTRRAIRRHYRSMIWGGLVFVLAGALIIWLGITPDAARQRHVPGWVLAVVGGVFLLPGLLLLFTPMVRRARINRHAAERAEAPDQPWIADGWNREGTTALQQSALQMLVMCAFVALFFTPFNYLIFVQGGPYMWLFPGSIVALLQIGVFAGIFQAIKLLLGFSKVPALRYHTFPFFIGEEFRGQLIPSRPTTDTATLSVRLVCVSTRLVKAGNMTGPASREVASSTITIEASGSTDLTVPIPANGLPAKPDDVSNEDIEWLLVVKGEGSGQAADPYVGTFLIPVYRRP